MTAALVGTLIAPTTAMAAGLAPTPVDDTPTVDEDTTLVVDVLANDTDPEDDALHVSGAAPISATYGTGSWNPNGTLTFTPKANWSGTVPALWYRAHDGTSSTMAWVTITVDPVDDPPTAVDDIVTVVEDTATDVTAAILANDSDPEGDPFDISAVADASGGSVDLTGGVVTFTPDPDVCGPIFGSFDYTLQGEDASDDATVMVDITCVNDGGPTAVDDFVTVVEDLATDVTVTLLDNDTDPDFADELTVTAVADPVGGTVAVVAGVVTFTPAANLCGATPGAFDYTVSDGELTDTGSAVVDILCVNDPPVAVDDDATGTEDDDLVILAATLVANDTDADDDAIFVDSVGDPEHGSVLLSGEQITFTPAADVCGEASFDYLATDGAETSGSATVTIDVECVNDAPVAVDDTATVGQATAPASHDVLDNDTDIDGDDLTVSNPLVDAAAGTVSVVANQVRYAPAVAFTGDAVITYTVSDGALSDTGTLTVTVVADDIDPVAVAPTVAFGTGRVNETAPLVISWSATDDATGIAGYEVQAKVGAGAWTTVYTGTGTSTQLAYAFGTDLQWQVRATDGAGNVSDWAGSAVRRLVAYQGASPVTYTGTWTKVARPAASGTGYRYTTTAGRKVQLTFTGLGVLYVAPKLTTGGYAKVTIAGVTTRVRLKAAATTHGQIIRAQMWATSGSHTIRVVNDQGGRRTTFDAFVVLQ